MGKFPSLIHLALERVLEEGKIKEEADLPIPLEKRGEIFVSRILTFFYKIIDIRNELSKNKKIKDNYEFSKILIEKISLLPKNIRDYPFFNKKYYSLSLPEKEKIKNIADKIYFYWKKRLLIKGRSNIAYLNSIFFYFKSLNEKNENFLSQYDDIGCYLSNYPLDLERGYLFEKQNKMREIFDIENGNYENNKYLEDIYMNIITDIPYLYYPKDRDIKNLISKFIDNFVYQFFLVDYYPIKINKKENIEEPKKKVDKMKKTEKCIKIQNNIFFILSVLFFVLFIFLLIFFAV